MKEQSLKGQTKENREKGDNGYNNTINNSLKLISDIQERVAG